MTIECNSSGIIAKCVYIYIYIRDLRNLIRQLSILMRPRCEIILIPAKMSKDCNSSCNNGSLAEQSPDTLKI